VLIDMLPRRDLLAKDEYKDFLDNVNDKRADIEQEVDAAMAEWPSVADQMGTREDFERLVKNRINSF
jgi:hypothetical protein